MNTSIHSDQVPFLSSPSHGIDVMEGDITLPSNRTSQNELSTLDEPVLDTIKRDLRAVVRKFGYALIPRHSSTLLQQWDLWGPLILMTTLAILLQAGSSRTSDGSINGGMHFAEVFTLMLIGSIAVTINSQLLGGKISFFQCVCVLGYCLLPLLLSAFANDFLLLVSTESTASVLRFLRFLVVMASFAWTMHASTRFLGQSQHPDRRMLVLYPIFLFYFLIAWLIILRA